MRGIRSFLLALKYARRELRAGLSGFYIFLACLALGTAAIAGVQSVSAALIDSLHGNGRLILGGDLSLRTVYQPASPEQVKFLNRLGVVSAVAETRAMTRTEDGQHTALAEIKAVDPFYPLYGKLILTDGAGMALKDDIQDLLLAPTKKDEAGNIVDAGPWGVAVEKELLTRLNLKVGGTLMIGAVPLQIRAVIAREPDRLSGQQFTLAPRAMISSIILGKTGVNGQGSQTYYSYRLFMPQIRSIEALKKAEKRITDAFPKAAWRGRTWFNASPRLESTIGQLTQFLTLIGLATLLIGGVGVSNAVRSFLESKRANIATLKCLGAPSSFVFRVYMAMILMLAAFGIAGGLVLGAVAAHAGGAVIMDKLSLMPLPEGLQPVFYTRALLAAGVFGLLSAFGFSVANVGRAARIAPNNLFRDLVAPGGEKTPLNASLLALISFQALALMAIMTAEDKGLALWFVLGAAGVTLVFRLYAALLKTVLRRLPVPASPETRMALSNLFRPGNITSDIVLSLGLGLTVLAAVALVQGNFSRILAKDVAEDTPSFFFLDIRPDQREDFTKHINAFATARHLTLAPSFHGRITAVNGKPANEALANKSESWVIRSDRGFTWTRGLPPHSEITAGKWWAPDYSGPPLVAIATNVARAFNIGVGDKITVSIFGAEVTAEVACVREIDWGSFAMNFAVTFSPGLLEKVPANLIATVATDEKDEEALQTDISAAFPNVTVVRVRDALAIAQGMIRNASYAVQISALVTLLAGALVLSGGIAASRRRHVYDAVVLKVLGATRRRILKTFLLEYGFLGLLSALGAAVFGTLAARAVIVSVMRLTWSFNPSALALITLASLAVTLLAGFAGTGRALLQKPAPWLRNQ